MNLLTPIEMLVQDSYKSSFEYIKANLSDAMFFNKREELWKYTLEKVKGPGSALEFGVKQGYSINYMSNLKKDLSFFGFDSFEGLQEDWKGTALPKGYFDLGGNLPKVNSNVKLIKGWFNKTLPSFLEENKANDIVLLHLDADTYESTRYPLFEIFPYFKPGLVLIFDEYLGYPGWMSGEYLAFKELCEQKGVTYKYLAFSNMQVSLVMT